MDDKIRKEVNIDMMKGLMKTEDMEEDFKERLASGTDEVYELEPFFMKAELLRIIEARSKVPVRRKSKPQAVLEPLEVLIYEQAEKKKKCKCGHAHSEHDWFKNEGLRCKLCPCLRYREKHYGWQ